MTDGNLQSLLTGQILAMFVIAVAAAEVAIGVAILVAVYQNRQTAYVTDGNKLKYWFRWLPCGQNTKYQII